MKQSHILISIIWIVSIFSFESTFWATEICGWQEWYPLYECRVKNVCEEYKPEKPVYNSEEFLETESLIAADGQDMSSPTMELDSVKKLYRKNMGNIYKCSMIQSQINVLNNMQKFISGENSGRLSDTIGGQLQLRIRRLEVSSKTVGCTLSDSESIQNKLNILHETSYQACKYISYLEYLKQFYEQTNNVYSKEKQRQQYWSDFSFSVTPEQVEGDIKHRKNAVAQEISHTYQVFPIAYQAFSEYENNLPIHFLLEVIRADFLLLRQNLKETLMPIAQFWYKIINAMSH